MSELTITLVQQDIFWENPTANRAQLEEQLHDLDSCGDLILLPEAFTTGFSVKNVSEHAETMNLHTHKWMKQIAAQMNAAIGGSFFVKEDKNIFNRFVLVHPDGSTEHYDKKHLFRMGEEAESLSSGGNRLIFRLKGWRICPLICYDLRFPVWSRNKDLAYDLLVYVANWPSQRQEVWDTLLKARALENQAYVAGVNRVGKDGENIEYIGGSTLIDFKGKVQLQLGDKEGISQITLKKSELDNFREKFPVYLDFDGFTLN